MCIRDRPLSVLEPTLTWIVRAGDNPWPSTSGNRGWYVLPRERGKKTKNLITFFIVKKTLKHILKCVKSSSNYTVTVNNEAAGGLNKRLLQMNRESANKIPIKLSLPNPNLNFKPEYSDRVSLKYPVKSTQINLYATVSYTHLRAHETRHDLSPRD